MQKTSPPILFIPKRVIAKIERAKKINKPDADFLVRTAAEMLGDRLDATNREFLNALDLFSRFRGMSEELERSPKVSNSECLTEIGGGELDSDQLKKRYQAEISGQLPFEKSSFNLVTSIFGLHWSNDMPGMFSQIRNILAPDGLFLCVLPGDRTLRELRECLMEAEAALTDSASLRIDPFGEIRQLGGLLQRAGFALPVVDAELFTVRYASVKSLIDDLRAMGATSSLAAPSQHANRKLFVETERIYKEKHMDPDGKIRATFELVFLSGWAPHESQQKAMKPGTAKNQLKDFL